MAVQSDRSSGRSGKLPQRMDIIWLGIVSFFTDVSSEMIFPIIPLFLTSILNANMAIVGTIEGVAESSAAFLKLFSGWLSDRMKRKKPLIFIGYGMSTLFKPMLALATSWIHVLIVRVADRIGKGIRTSPRDAMIAAYTDSNKNMRGRYFGIHKALDTSGAVLGTLIASLLLWLLSGYSENTAYRTIFWLSLIPGLIAVALIHLKVREPEAKNAGSKNIKGSSDTNNHKIRLSFSLRGFSSNFKRFLLVILLFNLAAFSYSLSKNPTTTSQ